MFLCTNLSVPQVWLRWWPLVETQIFPWNWKECYYITIQTTKWSVFKQIFSFTELFLETITVTSTTYILVRHTISLNYLLAIEFSQQKWIYSSNNTIISSLSIKTIFFGIKLLTLLFTKLRMFHLYNNVKYANPIPTEAKWPK